MWKVFLLIVTPYRIVLQPSKTVISSDRLLTKFLHVSLWNHVIIYMHMPVDVNVVLHNNFCILESFHIRFGWIHQPIERCGKFAKGSTLIIYFLNFKCLFWPQFSRKTENNKNSCRVFCAELSFHYEKS